MRDCISGLMSRNIWSAARDHHVHRPFAHRNGRIRRRRRLVGLAASATSAASGEGRQRRHALGDGGFEQLHAFFVHRAADVARADVMIVGEDAGHFAIEIDALDPILLRGPRPRPRPPCAFGSTGGGGGGSLLRSV